MGLKSTVYLYRVTNHHQIVVWVHVRWKPHVTAKLHTCTSRWGYHSHRINTREPFHSSTSSVFFPLRLEEDAGKWPVDAVACMIWLNRIPCEAISRATAKKEPRKQRVVKVRLTRNRSSPVQLPSSSTKKNKKKYVFISCYCRSAW